MCKTCGTTPSCPRSRKKNNLVQRKTARCVKNEARGFLLGRPLGQRSQGLFFKLIAQLNSCLGNEAKAAFRSMETKKLLRSYFQIKRGGTIDILLRLQYSTRLKIIGGQVRRSEMIIMIISCR